MSNTNLFDTASTKGFGDIHLFSRPEHGLQAITAIHSLKRGPALGGCRIAHYPTFEAAFLEALSLAKIMTYKAVLADLPFGGGKTVIIQPPSMPNRDAFFASFGECIERMHGDYVTAVDVGTDLADMRSIAKSTRYVSGYTENDGDPSKYTAHTVLLGIQAAVKHLYNRDDLENIHVSIQGVGKVGHILATELHEAGAKLTVADMHTEACERLRDECDATIVAPQDIYAVDCDVFAPCALSNILNKDTIPKLNCRIVSGSANKQLATKDDAGRLAQRGILFVPEYVTNSGGLVYAGATYLKEDTHNMYDRIQKIYDILLDIFKRAQREEKTPVVIANAMAQEKLASEA
jgi:leucine dehydrogenase